jgi:hypothetical protein
MRETLAFFQLSVGSLQFKKSIIRHRGVLCSKGGCTNPLVTLHFESKDSDINDFPFYTYLLQYDLLLSLLYMISVVGDSISSFPRFQVEVIFRNPSAVN